MPAAFQNFRFVHAFEVSKWSLNIADSVLYLLHNTATWVTTLPWELQNINWTQRKGQKNMHFIYAVLQIKNTLVECKLYKTGK